MKRSELLILFVLAASGHAAFCPESCNCFEESGLIDCSDAQKTIVPEDIENPFYVNELILRGNRIKQLNFELQRYTNLTYLDMADNTLANIEDGAFDGLAKLHTLILSSNHLSHITNNTFRGLNNLIYLDMSQNHFNVLSDNAFSYFPRLMELNLTGNLIHTIADKAFTGLETLDSLNLMYNRLRNVPTSALEEVKVLRFLNLNGNRIKSLQDYAFRNLSLLVSMSIARNLIKYISEDAFMGLGENLKSLDLHRNYLRNTPSAAFLKLQDMTKLDLSDNSLSVISENTFHSLPNLEVIFLNNLNFLRRIDAHAFNLTSLKELHIALNPHLEFIHPKAFYNSPYLEKVYLNNNAIHKFPESLLIWDNLLSLDLSGNWIDCNCDARWIPYIFRDGDRPRKNVRGKFLRCRSPKHLVDRSVATMHPSEFDCDKPLLGYGAGQYDKQLIIGVLSASTAVVSMIVLVVLWHYRSRILSILQGQFKYKRQKNVFTVPQHEEDANLSIDTVA